MWKGWRLSVGLAGPVELQPLLCPLGKLTLASSLGHAVRFLDGRDGLAKLAGFRVRRGQGANILRLVIGRQLARLLGQRDGFGSIARRSVGAGG